MISKRAKTLIIRSCLFMLCLVLGAAIFSSLEFVENVGTEPSQVEILKQNLTIKYNITDHELLQLLDMAKKEDLDAQKGLEWNFSNSMFFAMTIMTTIGYGHISPSTWQGQLFCIFYSIIGIPVAGLALKSIGEYINIWVNGTMAFIDQTVRKKEQPSKLNSIYCIIITCVFFILMVLFGTFISAYYEGWTYMEGAYYTFISLSTIGFGDYVLNDGILITESLTKTVLLHLSLVYLLVGLGTLSALLCAVSDIIEIIADDPTFFATPVKWLNVVAGKLNRSEPEVNENDIEVTNSEDDPQTDLYEIRPAPADKKKRKGRGLFILGR